MRLTLLFDENYFATECIIQPEKFYRRAEWIRDNLTVNEGVVVIGGGVGFLTYYLLDMGISSVNLETSQWCYDNRVTEEFYLDSQGISFNKFDWIVSWSLLDCLDDTNVDTVCGLLNSFEAVSKGLNLHVFSCDNNINSADYITDGYFIKSHDYWRTKLPNANLICWDCKQVIQGDIHNVPIGLGVSD